MNTTTPAETPKDIIAEMRNALAENGLSSIGVILTMHDKNEFFSVRDKDNFADGRSIAAALEKLKSSGDTRIKNLHAEAALLGMTLVKEESK